MTKHVCSFFLLVTKDLVVKGLHEPTFKTINVLFLRDTYSTAGPPGRPKHCVVPSEIPW